MADEHDWQPPYSAASGLCGATVMRAGGGDECGLPRDHPVHLGFEEQMQREHAAYLERIRTGDLRTVVGALREWSEVESVPAQDEFDLILARLEELTA